MNAVCVVVILASAAAGVTNYVLWKRYVAIGPPRCAVQQMPEVKQKALVPLLEVCGPAMHDQPSVCRNEWKDQP